MKGNEEAQIASREGEVGGKSDWMLRGRRDKCSKRNIGKAGTTVGYF